jgi:hypothetical protein
MFYLSYADGATRTIDTLNPGEAMNSASFICKFYDTPGIVVREAGHVIVGSIVRDGAGGFKTIPATIVEQFK